MKQSDEQVFPVRIFAATITLSNGNGSAQWDHLGTLHRIPYEDYDQIPLIVPYLKKQDLALSELLDLVPLRQPGGWVGERYEVREVDSGDILCLWRVPVFCGPQALEIDRSGLFAYSGVRPFRGQSIRIYSNSIRRGVEERDTGAACYYWGKVFHIPAEEILQSEEERVERYVEEFGTVLADLPKGYQPGGQVELIGVRDPQTGEHQMMMRVPMLRFATSDGKTRRRGRSRNTG